MTRRVALSLILIVIVFTQKNFANVCLDKYVGGQGILYYGGSSVFTINGCSRDSMELGRAYLYQFFDKVPDIALTCNQYTGCNIVSSYCIQKYDLDKGKLFLSGDADKYGVNVWVGPNERGTCIGQGEHAVLKAQDTIDLIPLHDEFEEGQIHFTFYATARENSAIKLDHCVYYDINEQVPQIVIDGNFRVKKNNRNSLDLFNLLFDASASLQGLAYIEPIYYDHDEDPFTHRSKTYCNAYCVNESTMRCDPSDEITCWGINPGEDVTAYRVKIPAWQEDIWGLIDLLAEPGGELPSYMQEEGWGVDLDPRQISLDVGSFGKIYFALVPFPLNKFHYC